jgi:peroxiredoxin
MPARTIISSLLLIVCLALPALSQDPPTTEPKSYATYEALFDDFDKQRQVLLTKWDRLRGQETVKPDEMKQIEDQLKALDGRYADALTAYITANPKASDLMPARFELTVATSRLDDRLEKSIAAADDFLKNHEDADLAADVRFLRGQTYFRMKGRESEALVALDDFIKRHPERQEADTARMMRVRMLLFLDKVSDARSSLEALLKTERVKKDDEAKAYLQGQLDNLDWIGREAPAFSLVDVKGETRKSADYAGKPLLLLTWDSTSGACLGELPFVQEARKRFGEKINFLGISVNESKPALDQWLDKNPEALKFPTLWIDRDEANSLVKKLDVSLIPFLVLVDAQGKIYRYDVRSDDMLRYAEMLAGQ